MRILLNGCFGRLCSSISTLAAAAPACCIAGGVPNTPADVPVSFPVYKRLGDIDIKAVAADVIIDATNAAALPGLLEFATAHKLPLVICTTGYSQGDLACIEAAARDIPILRSANMSLGVNLLTTLIKIATNTLVNHNFDIEISEAHHNKKKDSPSGTALLLANEANSVIEAIKGAPYAINLDRSDAFAERDVNEIGISARRGGNIVGEHSVLFAGHNEAIEISHTVFSREVFAQGALAAAAFIKSKSAGLYSMHDVLNILG